MMPFFVPAKFCISIVFNFSWDLQLPQERLETILVQNFGGTKKSIMVFLKKTHVDCRPRENSGKEVVALLRLYPFR